MTIFPATPVPTYPLEVSQEWKTLTTAMQSGKEQRRKLWSFPRRSIKAKYKALTQAEVDSLYRFHAARGGSYEAFYYDYPFVESHVDEFIARGDGTSVVFDVPSPELEIHNLMQNGGFESWTGSGPALWTASSGTPSQEISQVKFGESSLRIDNTATSNYGVYQDLLEPVGYAGVVMGFGCWVYTNIPDTYIQLHDGVGSSSVSVDPVKLDQWQFISQTRTIDTSATQVRLNLYSSASGLSGTAIFDGAIMQIGVVDALDPNRELRVKVGGSLVKAAYLLGGGTGGLDRIRLSTAPAQGVFVSADFHGRLRYRVRFAEDKMSKELFMYTLYNSGIEMQEARVW